MCVWKWLLKRVRYLFEKQTLGFRLRLWGLILILLPSLLMVALLSVNVSTGRTERRLAQLEQTALQQQLYLDNWRNQRFAEIRFIAQSNTARHLDIVGMERDFRAYLKNHNSFNNIIYVDKEGAVVVNTKAECQEASAMRDTCLREAREGREAISELLMIHDKPIMAFSVPLYDQAGQFQGMILGGVTLAEIDRIVQHLQFGKTGEVYFVTPNNMRITSPRGYSGQENTMPIVSEAISSALQGKNGSGIYKDYSGATVIGAYRWIDTLNWAVIVEMDKKEFMEPIYKQFANTLCVFFLVLFITCPLTLLMTNNIKMPIRYLMFGSQCMQQHSYNFQIDKTEILTAPRELQELCTTFNQMAATINKHQSHLEKQIDQRTKALKNVNTQLEQEIVERKQAEATLQQSEEKYRTLFETATDGVFVVSINKSGTLDKIIEVNEVACRSLGYTKEELLELAPERICMPMTPNEIVELKKKLHMNKHLLIETMYITKTGRTIPIEMNIHRFELAGQSVVLGIARDISERKELENELARLDRLNLVGEMAAGIGHEVRNPMTTVRGFLQMMARKAADIQQSEYLQLMIEELDRANSIITEFLSLAKNKAVNKHVCNLNEIITTLQPLLRADGLVNNKYVVVELAEIPDLLLDEKEIRQLILNLARNGLEAMLSGGTLTINTWREDNDVILAIHDEGCGIPVEIREKLGTPFFTTKEEGTGLGLAVCYSIVNRHNAVMQFTSNITGTTFFIRFHA